jgi:hypothetical protein
MELAPVGIAIPFEVTFDSPSLNVAMSVYDVSGVSPVLVAGPSTMTNVVGNTYYGIFTPPFAKPYVIFKAVYTNSTYESLSLLYSQGSESIIAQEIGGSSNGGGAQAVIGYIQYDPTSVNC